MSIKSDTICPLPWIHFAANNKGEMQLCCNTYFGQGRIPKNDGKIWKISEVTDIKEYYNSELFNEIRLSMLQNKRHSVCKKCYDIEDRGGISVRTNEVLLYDIDRLIQNTNLTTGELLNPEVKSLHFSWGNKCNLKCKMCAPEVSDQLIKEWEDMGFIEKGLKDWEIITDNWNFTRVKPIIEKISDCVDRILVTGGEPLINDDFYNFCLFLIETGKSKNITLRFYTNLTVTPTKFFNLWKEFKSVNINVSIDGVGPTYEYIRYPAKWKIVSENFDELYEFQKTVDNVDLVLHTVFSSFNAHNISEVISYFSKYFIFPYVFPVTFPFHGNPQVIPKYYKDKIVSECLDTVKKYDDRYKNNWSREKISTLTACLNMMVEADLSNQEFYSFNLKQDALRKIKSQDIIPWYDYKIS